MIYEIWVMYRSLGSIKSPFVAKMAFHATLLVLISTVLGSQWDCMSPSPSLLYYYSDVWSAWYPKLNTTSTLTVVGTNPNPTPIVFDILSLWFMHGLNITILPNLTLSEARVVQPSSNFSLSYPVYFQSPIFTNETYWVFVELYDGENRVSCWHLSELTVSAVDIVLGVAVYMSLAW